MSNRIVRDWMGLIVRMGVSTLSFAMAVLGMPCQLQKIYPDIEIRVEYTLS